MTPEAVLIPLYRGNEVVDYAWVDEEDAPLVSGYRWARSGPHAYSRKRLKNDLPVLAPVSMHRFLLGLSPGDGVVHHVNEDGFDNRRSNLKPLPDIAAHGATPHPRRDRICSPYDDPPPPHAREIAIKSLINAEPTAIPAKATAGSDNHGG